MDEKALSLVYDAPLGLTPDILNKLETYEDFLSFYIQLDQASSAFAWLKADLLFKMASKLGEKSIETLASDIKQPRSTVINYVRVARAFPQGQRDPGASFSIHFRASFADSYDDKNQLFQGKKRFEWVEKAIDEGMSTRELGEAIQRDKQRELLNVSIIPCTHCKKSDGKIDQYIIYSTTSHIPAIRLELHDACFKKIEVFIYGQTS